MNTRWPVAAVLLAVGAIGLWWTWPSSLPVAVPTTAARAVPKATLPSGIRPSNPEVFFIRRAEYVSLRASEIEPASVMVRHGPAWVRDLEDRYGVGPTGDMVQAMDAIGVDLTGVSWAFGGLSEGSDLVMLRSALITTNLQDDPEAYDEVLDGIAEAQRRWPASEELQNLSDIARYQHPRAVEGHGLATARESLDAGRSGSDLSLSAANHAVFMLMLTIGRDATSRDHDRLRWVAETYPSRQGATVLNGLHLAMYNGQPNEAARWLAALEALPEGQILRAQDRQSHRYGVVAMGAIPPSTWSEQVAVLLSTCWDGVSLDQVDWVSAYGTWRDDQWFWTAHDGNVPEETLAACLTGKALDPPPEPIDGVRVHFQTGPRP